MSAHYDGTPLAPEHPEGAFPSTCEFCRRERRYAAAAKGVATRARRAAAARGLTVEEFRAARAEEQAVARARRRYAARRP